MSVDLPSSTEPAVANRMSSLEAVRAGLEIAFTLPVLHRGLGDAVVGARLAALGDAGRGDLRDDVLERRGARLDRAGDDHVADRPVPHGGDERLAGLDVVR